MKNKFAVAVSVAVLVTLFLGGCATIEPGHVGIMVNKYGKNRGVQDYTTTTGFVTYNPFSTSVVEYPTYTQTVKWTADDKEEGCADTDESITFASSENVRVNVDVSLSYQLQSDKVPAFYVTFRNDDIKGFTCGYLHNVVRNTMNEVGGHYTVKQVMGADEAFINEVEGKIQSQVQNIGVNVSQFGFIGVPRPPQQIIDSINAAQQAQYLAQQKQNELQQTVADAAKVKAQAEGAAAAEVAKAQGQAQANKLISDSLTDKVLERTRLDVEWYRISKWNGQLPQITTGGNNGMLLNIQPQK